MHYQSPATLRATGMVSARRYASPRQPPSTTVHMLLHSIIVPVAVQHIVSATCSTSYLHYLDSVPGLASFDHIALLARATTIPPVGVFGH
jgi:hypothetical protein